MNSMKIISPDGNFELRPEMCRMCLAEKMSFVNIFETKTRDGCTLAEKLNQLCGIDAVEGDELPECVCMDCLREIKRLGNTGYDLWCTLDSLIRMDRDDEMPISSFHIPEDSLDFLLRGNGNTPPSSRQSKNCIDFGMESVTRVGKKAIGRECVEDDGSDSEVLYEYCWCSECNAEFVTRKELKLHLETHTKTPCFNIICKKKDTVASREELKLLTNDMGLLKNNLSCGRCQKQFKTVQKLVKHIEKDDFKCRPRRFEALNIRLKSLKTNVENNSISNSGARGIENGIFSEREICERSVADSLHKAGNENKGSKGSGYNLFFERGVENLDHIKKCIDAKTCNYISDIRLNKCLGDPYSNILNSTLKRKGKLKEFVPNNVVTLKLIKERCSSKRTSISQDGNLVGKSEINNMEDLFICDICKQSYKLKSKLREHIVMCHLSPVVHRCTVCYRAFLSEGELKTHCALHSSKNKYICTLCTENTSSRKRMIRHIVDLHNCKSACICSVCLSGFASKVELGLHQSCHLSEKKFKCSQCGREFISKRAFNPHVKFCQLKVIIHKCEICGKEFPTKGNLNIHSFIHNDFRKYPCSLCPRRFKQISEMYVHVRNFHLKLKPHECGICKKRFGLRSYLLNHYAVHSDDRPFNCKHCGKCYKLKNQVTTHIRLVHRK